MEHAPRRSLNFSNIPLAFFPQEGFSLIAVIGVLAVITIGLSLVTPALVQIWDRRHQETELLQLRRIADGIQIYLEQNKAFPPSLGSLIPDYAPFSAAQLTTNANGFPRYYAAHPAMIGFNNRTGVSAAALVNARFLLLSDLTQDIAPTITTPAEFETWWTTNESLVPNLHLHRSNVGHLFYSLAITPKGNGASYFISMPPATDSGVGLLPTHSAFHLVGTMIGFDEATTYSLSPEVQFALTTNTAYWFDPLCSATGQWNPLDPGC
jgi:type II secretory pathway pseudopilin PulG